MICYCSVTDNSYHHHGIIPVATVTIPVAILTITIVTSYRLVSSRPTPRIRIRLLTTVT